MITQLTYVTGTDHADLTRQVNEYLETMEKRGWKIKNIQVITPDGIFCKCLLAFITVEIP